MKYIYHYCAQRQNSDTSITYTDGIIKASNKILSEADYLELKCKISTCDNLIITSLSFLTEVE